MSQHEVSEEVVGSATRPRRSGAMRFFLFLLLLLAVGAATLALLAFAH